MAQIQQKPAAEYSTQVIGQHAYLFHADLWYACLQRNGEVTDSLRFIVEGTARFFSERYGFDWPECKALLSEACADLCSSDDLLTEERFNAIRKHPAAPIRKGERTKSDDAGEKVKPARKRETFA